jgi:predicted small secreted protein
MNRLVLIVMAIAMAASLTACNTVQGIGKDIEKGGQAIGKAAR